MQTYPMNAHDGEFHPALWTELLRLGLQLVQSNQTQQASSNLPKPAAEKSLRYTKTNVHEGILCCEEKAVSGKQLESTSRVNSIAFQGKGDPIGSDGIFMEDTQENKQRYAPVIATVFGERHRWSPLELSKRGVRRLANYPLDVSFESLCEHLRSL